jgi:hypothetical protein
LANQIAYLEAIAAQIIFVKVQPAIPARIPMIVFPDYHAHQVYASPQTALHAQCLLSAHPISAAAVFAKATAIQAKLVLATHNA